MNKATEKIEKKKLIIQKASRLVDKCSKIICFSKTKTENHGCGVVVSCM